MVGAYLSMLGLHIDAIAYLTSASPDNVVHITRLTARKYSIAVSFFDNNGEVEEIGYTAVPPTQPSSAAVSAPAVSSPVTPPRECSGRIGYVTGLDPHGDNNLSVRDGPHTPKGLGHEIDELFTGDSVCIAGFDGTWLHVQYLRSGPAKTGWVHSHYVRLSAPPSSAPVAAPAASPPATPPRECSGRIGYVTGLDPHGDNNLSVRDGPHTPKRLGNEIDELFTGDSVCIASFDGTWLHVQYIRSGPAKTGWVHSHYIRLVESPSTAHQQSP
ncbi:MAG: hypothetical protein M3Z96_04635 [Pseudomonadota bacterium]|nr:hypothetical protein [Pseudomonadota bacterium]